MSWSMHRTHSASSDGLGCVRCGVVAREFASTLPCAYAAPTCTGPFSDAHDCPLDPKGWQPIAAVPNDGTVSNIIAAWPCGDGYDVGEASRDFDGAAWICEATNHRIEPTHWMPLPSPPSSAQEKEKWKDTTTI